MLITSKLKLIKPSIWPIYASIIIYSLLLGNVMKLYNKEQSEILIIISLIGLILSIYFWEKEILQEYVTTRETQGRYLGIILFIISEACVFFSLIFSYYYNTLIQPIEVSNRDADEIEGITNSLNNTIILFISGISATASIHYIRKYYIKSIITLIYTITLGIMFSMNQYEEYKELNYTITDSVYGSSFYTLTGFHGIHVIIGIILLIISLLRILTNHYSKLHFNLLTFSNLYWHFVDYVWILLFLIIYI